jgi:hypothetical protein
MRWLTGCCTDTTTMAGIAYALDASTRSPCEYVPIAMASEEKRHLGHFQNGYGRSDIALKTITQDTLSRAEAASAAAERPRYRLSIFAELCYIALQRTDCAS